MGAPGLRQRLPEGLPRIGNTKGALPLQLPSKKIKVTSQGAEELAPPAGS
jgi:hypothetical protein